MERVSRRRRSAEESTGKNCQFLNYNTIQYKIYQHSPVWCSSSKNHNTVAVKLQQASKKITICEEVKNLRKTSQFSQ